MKRKACFHFTDLLLWPLCFKRKIHLSSQADATWQVSLCVTRSGPSDPWTASGKCHFVFHPHIFGDNRTCLWRYRCCFLFVLISKWRTLGYFHYGSHWKTIITSVYSLLTSIIMSNAQFSPKKILNTAMLGASLVQWKSRWLYDVRPEFKSDPWPCHACLPFSLPTLLSSYTVSIQKQG